MLNALIMRNITTAMLIMLSFRNAELNLFCLFVTLFLYFCLFHSNNVVPIVYGARKDDYIRACPPNSFIYAGDFSGPQDLAEYIMKLDQDPVAYSKYFDWKVQGAFLNSDFYCRLCTLLHAQDTDPYVSTYRDIGQWWKGDYRHKTCRNRNWEIA